MARKGKTNVKFDLHTHYYPDSFFDKIRELSDDFTFDKDPIGRTIIKPRGARFLGITPPMTDPEKRIEDMDRVGINVEVVSLSSMRPSLGLRLWGLAGFWFMTAAVVFALYVRLGLL